MSERFRLSGPAERDLDDIWDYVSERNRTAADRLLERLWDRFGFLALYPGTGQLQKLIGSSVRAFPEAKYVVYFRPIDAPEHNIEIMRVLHGSRDASRHFDSEQQ
jgi:plasmid stabilization system protein ParE